MNMYRRCPECIALIGSLSLCQHADSCSSLVTTSRSRSLQPYKLRMTRDVVQWLAGMPIWPLHTHSVGSESVAGCEGAQSKAGSGGAPGALAGCKQM